MDDIASLFRDAREKKGWSLREAAKRMGTGFGHLCQIENGHHVNLTGKTLLAAHYVYGISGRRLWAALATSTENAK